MIIIIIIIINPILIQVYPRKRGWLGFTPAAISLTLILHLARFMASFFSKPMLLLSFSTCIFHVFFGRPGFLLPLTSNSNAFLRMCPSSLLNASPYHLTPFPELHPANSCSCCHSCLSTTACIHPIPQITETSHRFHLFTQLHH